MLQRRFAVRTPAKVSGLAVAAVSALALTTLCCAAAPKVQEKPKDTLGYQDTPMLPGGKWHVHDGLRPQPPKVQPPSAPAADAPLPAPPSDAIILFDGTPASVMTGWRNDKGKVAGWKVADGALISTPGSGYAFTRKEFGDCQLHVEFATPAPGHGSSQGRGNSGVFLMGRYEIQVLDNYQNPSYPDGECGAVYGQYPPMVNVCRPPGEWQTYDIFFTRARFRPDKSVETPAYVTVIQNGILVQNHTAILGDTGHRIDPKYKDLTPTGPLGLQDHGNPVRYRNIWVRPLE